MRRETIALLATSYPASRGDASGHFVRAEARALAAQGHDVHVLAPRPLAGDVGITVHAVGGAALFAWPGAVARAQQRPTRLMAAAPFLARAVRKLRMLRPDRIEAHWMLPCAFPIAWAASSTATLHVTCHGADVRLLCALPFPARTTIVRALLTRGARIRFVAEDLRTTLLAALPSELATTLAPLTRVTAPLVDVDDYQEPPYSMELPYVIGVGRLVPSKRFDVVVRALPSAAPALDLVIVGDGPAEASLRALAAEIAPARVHFLGRRSRPETLGWIAGACALVHPSAVDAAPTAVLEARALGVPVISAGAGDAGTWEGVQHVARTREAFAAALRALLDP